MTSDEQVPSVHDLLNDATLWLQYARGVTAMLADLIHEAEDFDCKHLSLSLEAIAAMTSHGTRQLGEARARMNWEASVQACARGAELDSLCAQKKNSSLHGE
jgi:phosphoribosyl 1,2-cyclic phosphodiesterase